MNYKKCPKKIRLIADGRPHSIPLKTADGKLTYFIYQIKIGLNFCIRFMFLGSSDSVSWHQNRINATGLQWCEYLKEAICASQETKELLDLQLRHINEEKYRKLTGEEAKKYGY